VTLLQSYPVEARILLVAAAISLCLSLYASIEHRHQTLDERAMLSAVLASGGMPFVYSPPALCPAPADNARIDYSRLRALFRD
jgi:hypothetical protein